MKLVLSPARADERPSLSVTGDVLTVGGEAFDFTALGEGDVLPGDAIASPWLMGATRTAGEIVVTVLLSHGAQAPEEARFPDPVTVASGDVTLPAYEV